ncbi:DNA polymerase Y family protein [Rhizobium straminoryzae]|uniref:DNA polymerase Y family protein n=2 Tax=Rhizobium straminoryzae TaxID=1387186 RepID=A0A549SV23_9HYPH|nr:DNA polymerase Y family protein [Rhizobium straminoryzae]
MTAVSWLSTPQDRLRLSNRRPRILALHFPRLPTDRILRRRWGLSWRLNGRSNGRHDDTPVVVAGRRDNGMRLLALDETAETAGLRMGQGLAEARAICPNLIVIEEDAAADRRLLEALADWCDRFTPLVGLDGTDGLFLDITGCTHLFGGEAAMLQEILTRLTQMGLAVRGAISSAPGLSWALARFDGNRIVAEDEQEGVLAPLPVAALRLDDTLVQALHKVGLRQVGDLLEAPRAPLARRFGADLMLRLDQATGADEEPISPRRPVAHLSAERRLAEPIRAQDDILALAATVAEGLKPGLEARGAGGRVFELVLFRVDGQVFRLSAGASRPLRDPPRIAKLFAERLKGLHDDLDAGFGFEILRINVLHHEVFDSTQGDFEGDDRRSLSLSDFVDQVSARLGPEALQTCQLRESHVPERAFRMEPALRQAPARIPLREAPPLGVTVSRAERPLRLFARPELLETFAVEVPDGPPMRFRWRRLTHRVLRAEGPERLAAEWWRDGEEALTRDYFRLESDSGQRFWVYRQGLYDEVAHPRWFMHGIFA